MKLLKLVPALALALVSFSAVATQKDITVVASVDPAVELLQADGTALPTTMTMAYLPGNGLQPTEVNTRIFTNAASDMTIRLATAPTLINNINAAAPAIPLGVTFGGTAVTTAGVVLTEANLFPGGDITSGSVAQMLRISQATPGAITHAGTYQGVVGVVVTPNP
ncbi:CS1 type fimbrial major subunit [Noviluteimonas gilva]|uniref:Cro/Cl family transcriptional regulator n=1 Tax=Noviluteimonas gilva TaxID=2682097 RepID=A0A7C9I3S9_9GAMM|nr:CS1 type fimbrial major subunit [Lysobacter gilvus]MUV13209.1 Cro/Cl family transcriptional regulator [Lysobacter gilvus]